MWKKIAVAGGVGAAVLAGGTIALAATDDVATTGSGTPAAATSSPSANSPSASSGSAKAKAHRHAGEALGKRFEHGEWVTKTTSGTETHDAIRGTASAVNPTSITVKAEDGYALTFTVDSNTKVVLRENGKGSAKKGAISDVKTGQHVLVAGTKSGSKIDAKHLLDTGTA
jgi:hypothetical protein